MRLPQGPRSCQLLQDSHGDTAFVRNVPGAAGQPLLWSLEQLLPSCCSTLGSAGLLLPLSHPSLFQLLLCRSFVPQQPRCSAIVPARLSRTQSSSTLQPWLCQTWENLPAASDRALHPPHPQNLALHTGQRCLNTTSAALQEPSRAARTRRSQSCATLSPHHLEASGQRHKIHPQQPAEGLDAFASCKCTLFLT